MRRIPVAVDRFVDPLPIFRSLNPTSQNKGRKRYRVGMLEFQQKMHSQLPPTRLWGYEGQYPGPMIEAERGEPIEVVWENHLPMHHLFKVDLHIHGAMAPTPEVRTVPHLHGARTESESDGLPEKWFTPGKSALYKYPNEQQAATLWYHDHAVGITRLNVYAGLSGFYLLRDEQERSMGLPQGEYEIPLLLQDRTLDAHGQLVYCPTFEGGAEATAGQWAPEFFGNVPVVNGAIYPYIEVEPRPYRLRVLNGSNSRFVHLYLNLAKRATDIPALVNFHQIGSDGGLLPAPVALSKLLLGSAERADLIVDFSKCEGKTVTLCNDAAAPYPGWSTLSPYTEPLYEWMQFRVTRPLKTEASTVRMTSSIPFEKYDPAAAVKTRDFMLAERMDDQGRSLGVRINEKGYDDPVTEVVKLGTLEKWRFINTTDDAHPMHLHLVQFQVLERQGFDAIALQSGTLKLVGVARKPAPSESGWKDTAVVGPRDVLSILVRFDGYAGRFVYHCHMLEHEDNDMMRPFEVAH